MTSCIFSFDLSQLVTKILVVYFYNAVILCHYIIIIQATGYLCRSWPQIYTETYDAFAYAFSN